MVNGIEEKGTEFLKHSMLNETLLWMLIVIATKTSVKLIITITFPGKQTIMKHDMNKFNLTQFECRIQNLINLLVKRKKLNAFLMLLSF